MARWQPRTLLNAILGQRQTSPMPLRLLGALHVTVRQRSTEAPPLIERSIVLQPTVNPGAGMALESNCQARP